MLMLAKEIGRLLSGAATTFMVVFNLFNFADRISSQNARDDLTKYLKRLEPGRVSALPDVAKHVFSRAFGENLFTFKSFIRSLAVSLFFIVFLYFLLWLEAPGRFREFWLLVRYDPYKDHAPEKIGFWFAWSMLQDYFNLVKVRFFVDMASRRKKEQTMVYLAAMLIIDAVTGFLIVAIASSLSELIIASYYTSGGELRRVFIDKGIFAYLGERFKEALESMTSWQVDTPFYIAAFIPSFWLWLYFLSAVISRLVLKSRPVIYFGFYALDIDDYPIRSIGVFAATIASVAYIVAWILARMLALSEAYPAP